MRFGTLAALALLTLPLAANADDCSAHGTLTGQVKTVNFSQELQYGVAAVHIEKNGKTFYEGQGVIIGQVVGQQDNGLPILNHTIYFADGSKIRTFEDKVESLLPADASGCRFTATERLTSAKGRKKLRRLTNDEHDVLAEGTVSYCPDEPRNELTLSGTVCIN